MTGVGKTPNLPTIKKNGGTMINMNLLDLFFNIGAGPAGFNIFALAVWVFMAFAVAYCSVCLINLWGD